ncbi:DUF6427 family protein [Aequorivita lipolytica]|uniref:Beta-carotene 15,15'-monooxygenase n=1 Tax=Aequorivita lipolytica TaxID=153267 RepID=A0A5C6YSB5_9FLAO|nr:DUF6427 family protein [Aequorivita lipolytica]TXD70296.1 hypothetical protein ESV24_03790 [Aequorivita lipolytica]SRX50724.1 hypothetical protein AEQU2_01200 [Aequorivita lipolytica]
MLTSFFGKSNPINYLLLGVFIIAGYLLGAISHSEIFITPSLLVLHLAFIIISVLSMLLLDFIIRKNHLTKNNTYAILFFTCFLVMLPVAFLQHTMLLANIFLLLALRRIMSLQSDKNSERKIFDASLWISVASLFHFWSLLFFIPLWIAIVQKPNSNYKQMLVPFTGFFAVIIINTAYQLVTSDGFSWFLNWKDDVSFDFSAYNSASILVPVTIILALYIWTSVHRILKISALPLKEKSSHLLLLYVSITALFITLGASEKTGAEVLFILAPVAIISANYIESSNTEIYREKDPTEFWFKETMLWIVVLLPFVFLLV